MKKIELRTTCKKHMVNTAPPLLINFPTIITVKNSYFKIDDIFYTNKRTN